MIAAASRTPSAAKSIVATNSTTAGVRRGTNGSSSAFPSVGVPWIHSTTTGAFVSATSVPVPSANGASTHGGRSIAPSGNTPTTPPDFTWRTASRSMPASAAV